MSGPLTGKKETNIDRFVNGFQTGVFFDESDDFRIVTIPPRNIFSLELKKKEVFKQRFSRGPFGCTSLSSCNCPSCNPPKKNPDFIVKIKWYGDSDHKSVKSEEFGLFTDLKSESFNKKIYDALNRLKSDENIIEQMSQKILELENIIEKMSQKILELENIIHYAPETGKGFKPAKENFNEPNQFSGQNSQSSIPK